MTDMQIRKSTYEDIDTMLQIYKDAREFMKAMGNPNQWINGYPTRSLLLRDIGDGNSYVCIMDEVVVGTFYYVEGVDPTYKNIYYGQWLNNQSYGVIHRIASVRKNKGVGSFCLDWCFNKINNIKIDTHKDNIPMQNLLTKKGYIKCGIIYIASGDERLAYQKY